MIEKIKRLFRRSDSLTAEFANQVKQSRDAWEGAFNESPGLICPRCEKPLNGHDDQACARRMSRRWFIGAAVGAAATAILAPGTPGEAFSLAHVDALNRSAMRARVGDRLAVDFTGTLTNHEALISVLLERKDGNSQTVRMLPVPTFKEQTVFIADSNYRIMDVRMVASNDKIFRRPAILIRRKTLPVRG